MVVGVGVLPKAVNARSGWVVLVGNALWRGGCLVTVRIGLMRLEDVTDEKLGFLVDDEAWP